MKLTAIILSLFAVVATVQAATTDMEQHEVLFNATTGNLKLGGGPSGATNSPTNIGVTFGYNYQFMPGVMIGISPTISSASNINGGTTSLTTLSFLAGPTVNFPFTDKFDNAFFLTGGIGLQYMSAGLGGGAASTTSTNFQFGFELGKRFELFEHVVYRPSVSFVKVTGTNNIMGVSQSAQIAFNVLSFAAAF